MNAFTSLLFYSLSLQRALTLHDLTQTRAKHTHSHAHTEKNALTHLQTYTEIYTSHMRNHIGADEKFLQNARQTVIEIYSDHI